MNNPRHLIVAETCPRLDKFLAEACPEISRSRWQDLLKEGTVLRNGEPAKARDKVHARDKLEFFIPEARAVEVAAQEIPLKLLFEDEHLLVVDKPSGLVVHPAAGNPDGTLVNALLYHCQGSLSGIGGELRPGIVHRLDKDTSGCMVVAKHDQAHARLSKMFAERSLTKIYLAVVEGRPKAESGTIKNYLGRHPVDRKRRSIVAEDKGKIAVTKWICLNTVDGASLIQCHLLTGRTHQIRVHMKESLKCPILGDELYARPSRQHPPTTRLLLHAWCLEFKHPMNGQELAFVAEIPPQFSPWTMSLK